MLLEPTKAMRLLSCVMDAALPQLDPSAETGGWEQASANHSCFCKEVLVVSTMSLVSL